AEDALVEEVCREASQDGIVVPANHNSPGQIVIGGHAAAVERALALLGERGVRKAVKLAVSVPSHTPLMREAANRLDEAMANVAWNEPAIPVVQNVDAQVHEGVQAIRDALVRQLYLQVQWTGCGQALATAGATRIGECGPGKVLSGLARRIDKRLDARALGTPRDFELVPGACRGIGAAIADPLAARGATVIGTATSEAGAQAIGERLAAHGGQGRVLDVSVPGQVEALIDAIGKEVGPLSILVNNAGITRDGLLMRMGDEDWQAVIDTNLSSVYRACKA